MKIIAGFGNPGAQYRSTRHNIGFEVIDELARRWKADNWRHRFEAEVFMKSGSESLLLMKPQTYMNLSGVALREASRYYKVDPTDIIVIHDDLDLEAGRLRIREKGGSGGHRGIESMFVELGVDTFVRIRIGIGRPPESWNPADFVLSRFTTEEIPLMEAAVLKAADGVEMLLARGLTQAMNQYNR